MCGGNYNNTAPKHQPELTVVLPPDGSLYAMLEEVFSERVPEDALYSHIWTCSLAGRRYAGPFESCGFHGEAECTGEQQVPLEPLGVQVGASGSFSNESASFKYQLVGLHSSEADAHAAAEQLAASQQQDKQKITAELKPDQLTAEEIAAAGGLRVDYEVYMSADNAWVRDRRSFQYVKGKPKVLGWSEHNGDSGHYLFKIHEIMSLLLNAAVPFAKAWQSTLQYCCVDRTKAACANRYSSLKKNDWERVGSGQGLSKTEAIVQAKLIAQGVSRERLQAGVPALGPKPGTGSFAQDGGLDDSSDY